MKPCLCLCIFAEWQKNRNFMWFGKGNNPEYTPNGKIVKSRFTMFKGPDTNHLKIVSLPNWLTAAITRIITKQNRFQLFRQLFRKEFLIM